MPFTIEEVKIVSDNNLGVGSTLTNTLAGAPSDDEMIIQFATIANDSADNTLNLDPALVALTALNEDFTTGRDGQFKCGWKKAASDDATWDVENDAASAGNEETTNTVIVISGVDAINPFRVVPSATHADFINNNATVPVPAIGGGFETDCEVGDLAVMFHWQMEDAFDTGTPGAPPGATMQATNTPGTNHLNCFIATRVLEAGDITAGEYSPGNWQHTYDASEGAHNSVSAVIILKPQPTGKQDVTISRLEVTGATQANPVRVTVASHGWSTGQQIRISEVAGMTEINSDSDDLDDVHTITVVDANNVDLDGVDGTGYGMYTSGGYAHPGYSLFEGASPGIIDGDIARVDSTTDPDAYAITFNPDGTLSYAAGGDDSRQAIVLDVWDVSVGAFAGEATFYFNNVAPSLIGDPIPFQDWSKDIAIDPIDLTDYIEDFEGDSFTSVIAGGPTGVSVVNNVISGTPTETVDAGTVTVTVTDAIGDSTDFVFSYDVNQVGTMPNVIGLEATEAISAVQDAGFPTPAIVLIPKTERNVGIVDDQTPEFGTTQSIEDSVAIFVSSEALGFTVPEDGNIIIINAEVNIIVVEAESDTIDVPADTDELVVT